MTKRKNKKRAKRYLRAEKAKQLRQIHDEGFGIPELDFGTGSYERG